MQQTVGPYQVGERLGTLPIGDLWAASRPGRAEPVTLLRLHDDLTREHRFRGLLRLEVARAGGVRHPALARPIEVAEHGGVLVVAYEWRSDQRLLSERLAGGGLAPGPALALVRQLAAGLDAAHDRRLVHGMLSPASALLGEDGSGVLVGLGLLTAVDDAGLAEIARASLDPAYVAPEQAGERLSLATADGYALAVLAHAVLRDMPEAAEAAVTRQTAAAPEARYPTCLAFADALGTALAGQAVPADAAERTGPAWPTESTGPAPASSTAEASVASPVTASTVPPAPAPPSVAPGASLPFTSAAPSPRPAPMLASSAPSLPPVPMPGPVSAPMPAEAPPAASPPLLPPPTPTTPTPTTPTPMSSLPPPAPLAREAVEVSPPVPPPVPSRPEEAAPTAQAMLTIQGAPPAPRPTVAATTTGPVPAAPAAGPSAPTERASGPAPRADVPTSAPSSGTAAPAPGEPRVTTLPLTPAMLAATERRQSVDPIGDGLIWLAGRSELVARLLDRVSEDGQVGPVPTGVAAAAALAVILLLLGSPLLAAAAVALVVVLYVAPAAAERLTASERPAPTAVRVVGTAQLRRAGLIWPSGALDLANGVSLSLDGPAYEQLAAAARAVTVEQPSTTTAGTETVVRERYLDDVAVTYDAATRRLFDVRAPDGAILYRHPSYVGEPGDPPAPQPTPSPARAQLPVAGPIDEALLESGRAALLPMTPEIARALRQAAEHAFWRAGLATGLPLLVVLATYGTAVGALAIFVLGAAAALLGLPALDRALRLWSASRHASLVQVAGPVELTEHTVRKRRLYRLTLPDVATLRIDERLHQQLASVAQELFAERGRSWVGPGERLVSEHELADAVVLYQPDASLVVQVAAPSGTVLYRDPAVTATGLERAASEGGQAARPAP